MKLTVSEAAALLGTTGDRVLEWIEDRGLPAQHLRGDYRLNRTEILEWATGRGMALSPRAFGPLPDETPLPSVGQALRAGGIHYDVASPDAESALRNIVELLPLADSADRQMLRQILLARRALGMTPVGEGIAIPHVRTPIVLSPGGAVLALAFLTSPLDLGAFDHRPVDTLFFLVSSTVAGHLAILSRLASCLKTETFRQAVKRRLPAEEILRACAQSEGAA